MKLFILKNLDAKIGSFDNILVCANNQDDAKNINPNGLEFTENSDDWAKNKDSIICTEIGEAKQQKAGVIMTSFIN